MQTVEVAGDLCQALAHCENPGIVITNLHLHLNHVEVFKSCNGKISFLLPS